MLLNPRNYADQLYLYLKEELFVNDRVEFNELVTHNATMITQYYNSGKSAKLLATDILNTAGNQIIELSLKADSEETTA